ncbi:MAG: GIY-YIG nuclease family protein [Bacteroidota bacterium]
MSSGRSSARLERGAFGAKVAGSSMVVYILRSRKTGRYYTGVAEEIGIRLGQHNAGRNSSTRNGTPWEIVYTRKCDTRSEALEQEKHIKSRGAGRFLESLKNLD